MSFIVVTDNDIWSDIDIVNRTEAMIASVISPAAVAILQRKVTAAAMGEYTLTLAEQMQLEQYKIACYHAGVVADSARKTMADLLVVMQHERGEIEFEKLTTEQQVIHALRTSPLEPVNEVPADPT